MKDTLQIEDDFTAQWETVKKNSQSISDLSKQVYDDLIKNYALPVNYFFYIYLKLLFTLYYGI